jgi:hypothetical protein
MPEGCPPSAEHIAKTFSFLEKFASEFPMESSMWTFGDRLQYRLGIR